MPELVTYDNCGCITPQSELLQQTYDFIESMKLCQKFYSPCEQQSINGLVASILSSNGTIIYLNSFSELPDVGVENILYVDKSNGQIAVWNIADSEFKKPFDETGGGAVGPIGAIQRSDGNGGFVGDNNLAFNGGNLDVSGRVALADAVNGNEATTKNQMNTAISSILPLPTVFNSALLFDAPYRISSTTISAPTELTPNISGAIAGYAITCKIIVASTIPTTSGFRVTSGSFTNDFAHQIYCVYNGEDYIMSITRLYPVDTTPPLLQSAAVNMGNANKIVLNYSEALKSSPLPDATDFIASGKTITAVAISGTTVTLTVDSNYTSVDTITVSYTAGANPIEDTSGNLAASFSNHPVINYLTGPVDLPFTTRTSLNYAVVSSDKVFTATSGGFVATGLEALKFPVNPSAGRIYFQLQDIANDSCIIGVSNVNSEQTYTSIAAGAFMGGTNGNAVANGTIINSVTTLSLHDWYGIEPNGGTWKLVKSSDGTNWTVVYDTGVSTTGNWYVVCNVNVNMHNPKGEGLI